MISQKIGLFIFSTIAFSWLLWTPLLLNQVVGTDLTVFPGQFYVGLFGPLVGVFITFFWNDDWKEMKRWLRKTFSLRFSPRWFIVVLVLLVFYAIIAIPTQAIVVRAWPDWSQFGITAQFPDLKIGSTFLYWFLMLGIAGETGWRTFLLPELYKKISLSRSAALTALIWMLWQLPLFWFVDDYVGMGYFAILWFFMMFYSSIILAWLSRGSSWSLFPAAFWLSGLALLMRSEQSETAMIVTCSTLIIVHGLLISRKLVRENRRLIRRK